MEGESQKGFVTKLLHKMSDEDRLVLSLYLVERCSDKEIARVLRMDELRATRLVTAALVRLNETMEMTDA